MPAIRCRCRRIIQVDLTQAGERLTCECGELLTVPRMSHLNEAEAPIDVHPEPPPSVDEDDRDVIMMLTPIDDRISHEAMSNFLSACDRLIRAWEREMGPRDGFDVQVAVALFPNGRRFVDVKASPDGKFTHRLGLLKVRIQALAAPAVVEGPVAFAMRRRVGDGAPATPDFEFPFRQQLQGEGLLDELLMRAAGLESHRRAPEPRPKRTWGQWLHQLLFGEPRPTLAADHEVAKWTDDRGEPFSAPQQNDLLDEVEWRLQQEEYSAVIQLCTELIKLEVNADRALYLRGVAHSRNDNLQKGLADFCGAIDLEPSHPAYRAARAEVYFELGGFAEAEEDLNIAIRSNDREPGYRVRRAHCRLMLNQPQRALQDANEGLRLDPHNESCFVVRGLLHLNGSGSSVKQAEQAESDFRVAVEIDPDNPIHRVQLARALVSQGKFELAVSNCDDAIDLDSECGMAFGVRGYAEQQLERYDEVIPDCTRAIEMGFAAPAIHVARAIAYHAHNETELAIADCDAALALDPHSAMALNYRGVLKMAQGDVDAAKEDFEEAGRLEPEWSMPRGLLANSHRMQSDYEQAIDDYSKTIELDPSDLAARVNRALCWIDVGEEDKALSDLDEAISLDPELAAAYVFRAQLYLQRDELDRAMTDLNAAISADPELADAYHLRAQLLQSEGRMDEAMRDYNRLIELSPDSPDAFVGRANAWIEMGNDEKVADDYKAAMELDPEAADALLIHRLLVEAQHLHQQEDYEQAVEKATEAIEHDEQCAPAYSIRASANSYAENWVEAAEDLTRMLDFEMDKQWIHGARGQVYAEMGEFEAAQNDFEIALEPGEDDDADVRRAHALSGWGLALVGLQRFDEAETAFDESVALSPDNGWVHYNRGRMFRELGRVEEAKEAFQRALDCDKPSLPRRKRERARGFMEKD